MNDIDVDADVDSSVGSVFLPLKLKPCGNKRKTRDQNQDSDCGSFDGFSRVKALNKEVNVKGEF